MKKNLAIGLIGGVVIANIVLICVGLYYKENPIQNEYYKEFLSTVSNNSELTIRKAMQVSNIRSSTTRRMSIPLFFDYAINEENQEEVVQALNKIYGNNLKEMYKKETGKEIEIIKFYPSYEDWDVVYLYLQWW